MSPSAFAQVQAQCSNYQDGKRWCDFCQKEVYPEPKHEPDCPVDELRKITEERDRLLDALRWEALIRETLNAIWRERWAMWAKRLEAQVKTLKAQGLFKPRKSRKARKPRRRKKP